VDLVMPRISYVSSKSFIAGEQTHSPENENIDFCVRCFGKINSLEKARDIMDVPDDVPDDFVDWEGEQDHPGYDGEGYGCYNCNRVLTGADD